MGNRLIGLCAAGVVALASMTGVAGPAQAAVTTNPFGGPTGSAPFAIAVDADGNVFTANDASDSVTRISADGTSTTQFSLSAGSYPSGIAVDADGNVFTANLGSNSVTRISADGTSITQFGGSTGKYPTAIAVDGDGNVFTANQGANTVTRISADGTSTTQFGTTGSGPSGIAVDADGNVYTSNQGANTVTRISASGTSTTPFGGATGNRPLGIAVDADGNVYIACQVSNAVTRISADGSSTTQFGTTGNAPTGIAVDADGNVYTADFSDNAVTRIGAGGTSAQFGGTTGNGPSGIAVDADGNVYTSNYSANSVTRISPDRGPVAFTSGAFPTTLVGSTTALTLTVTNTGEGSVRPTGITPAGAGVAVTGGTCAVGTRIPAGASCTVNLTWTPTATGELTGGSLIILYPGGIGSGEATALTGTAVQPGFSATPDPVTFPDQRFGSTSSPQTVTVTNTGTGDLNLGPTTLTGGSFAFGADTCSKATVPPGGTCTVQITFTPTTEGSKNGSVTFTSNAPGSPHSVALTGTGIKTVKKKQTLQAKLPKRIKLSGLTVITPANARTNAGQLVRTIVRGGPVGPSTSGEVRYFTVVRGPQGKTSVRTFGHHHLKLRVTQKAPATSGYTPFTRTATYTRGARG